LPCPLEPLVIVIHAEFDAAAQEQPDAVVNAIVPVVADAVGDSDVGDKVKVHVTPACVTVTVLPATVNVPVREAVPVLAAIL